VVDVVAILTNSLDARNYWKVLKSRLKKEGTNTAGVQSTCPNASITPTCGSAPTLKNS